MASPGRKRHDPISRPADGRNEFDEIENKDPDMHYVLTDPNDARCGTKSYLRRGYHVVLESADGPRAAGGRATTADGSEVRSGDLVLVARPMSETIKENERMSRVSREIEKRILKEENVEDGLRGRSGVRFRGLRDDEPDQPFPD